jgi:hypothetical protein
VLLHQYNHKLNAESGIMQKIKCKMFIGCHTTMSLEGEGLVDSLDDINGISSGVSILNDLDGAKGRIYGKFICFLWII